MQNPIPSLQQLNRTFIGSVLFIDIVGYSRRTVPDQLEIKEVFNHLLMEAVRNVAPAERIMVDTGDGAGVAFLGDPEDALFTALSLRDSIDAGKVTVGEPGFVRMGINLGPLKMVRDINGHTNMIGDGVNDAQRVMSFSDPGQVMVSHSYFDIISRFSRDYTKLFVYEGTRHDKHVREHEVYRFGPTEGAETLSEQLTEKMRDRSRARQPGNAESSVPTGGGIFNGTFPNSIWPKSAGAGAAASSSYGAQPTQRSGKPALRNALIATAVAAVALTGAVWSWSSKPLALRSDALATTSAAVAATDSSKTVEAATAATAPVARIAASSQSAPAAGAAATTTTSGKPAVSSPAVSAETPAPKTSEMEPAKSAAKTADKPASRPADKIDVKPTEMQAERPTEKSAERQAEKSADKAAEKQERKDDAARPQGTVKLAVQPWGEIYVDGSKRGVSPPLKSLSLVPGKHRIEIRNGQFAPHRQTVEVKSNAETTVQYVF